MDYETEQEIIQRRFQQIFSKFYGPSITNGYLEAFHHRFALRRHMEIDVNLK